MATTDKDKKQSAKNAQNFELNNMRHQENQSAVKALGLAPEKVERTVTHTSKKGTKVIVKTSVIEKNKRPSKLLRKDRRRQARIALGVPMGES